ncbi:MULTISPECIES: hypothetical protein [unclassified Methylobacterium]|uniref:hypothetical protein n=1 Tax=unclassified Methylobacterium TaxID=2615210 RepID=UPI002269A167|nr:MULTISPECIES: hypothetical protein [unclassified Methylobacterium]
MGEKVIEIVYRTVNTRASEFDKDAGQILATRAGAVEANHQRRRAHDQRRQAQGDRLATMNTKVAMIVWTCPATSF